MKVSFIRMTHIAQWLIFTLVVTVGTSAIAAELRYRIIDLGPVDGSSRTFAYGLNDHGDAVGHAVINTSNGNIANSRAVIWPRGGAPERLWYGELEACYLDAQLGYVCDQDKQPVVFGDLIGGEPRAINNAGMIVGDAQSSGYTGTPLPTGGIPDGVAFVWDEVNGRRTLGTLGGSNSEARGINEAGMVVGSADVLREFDFGQGPVMMNVPRAFIWDEVNGMRDLGTLGTDTQGSRGMGMNEEGQVVGWSIAGEASELAFVWSEDTGMRALDGLAGPGSDGRAIAVNNDGIVVGYSWNAQGILRAALWDPNGQIIELGVMPGDHSSIAWSVNESGYVVGRSETIASESHAFIWSQASGMIALADLTTNAEGWDSLNAWAINEKNEIVGVGRFDEGFRAFVMVPVPEPQGITLAVLLLGCLVHGRFRSRLRSISI
jgi:probable HAF family extracellular repeat protein